LAAKKVTKDVEVEEVLKLPVEELLPQGIIIAKRPESMEKWIPKTSLGKKIKSGEIQDIDEILEHGYRIMEPEIVDFLLPGLENILISVGQSKGKFGGGKRSIWKQTQKKTNEGNKPKFATLAVVGDKNGHMGIGYGKSKETVPAREKAIRNAKLNLIKIKSGCGSWDCYCGDFHSIPFKVSGRCGSVRITLIPAPKGTNLCTEREVQKMLSLTGLKDVYSKTEGQTKTKINLIYACFDALKKLSTTKSITKEAHIEMEASS
jgi:small subunit ribosomal protein S5